MREQIVSGLNCSTAAVAVALPPSRSAHRNPASTRARRPRRQLRRATGRRCRSPRRRRRGARRAKPAGRSRRAPPVGVQPGRCTHARKPGWPRGNRRPARVSTRCAPVARFGEQRHVEDDQPPPAAGAPGASPRRRSSGAGWLRAALGGGVGEDEGAHGCAVERAVGVDHRGSEGLAAARASRRRRAASAARAMASVSTSVAPMPTSSARDGALAAADAASQADVHDGRAGRGSSRCASLRPSPASRARGRTGQQHHDARRRPGTGRRGRSGPRAARR